MRGSFVPPKPRRRLRTLTRYRKTQIAERQREAKRLHKRWRTPPSSLTASRRTSLASRARDANALIAGTTDPEVLAELAHASCAPRFPRDAKRWRGA